MQGFVLFLLLAKQLKHSQTDWKASLNRNFMSTLGFRSGLLIILTKEHSLSLFITALVVHQVLGVLMEDESPSQFRAIQVKGQHINTADKFKKMWL